MLGKFTVPYFTGPNAPTMLGVDISKYFQAFNHPQQSVAMAVVVFVVAPRRRGAVCLGQLPVRQRGDGLMRT